MKKRSTKFLVAIYTPFMALVAILIAGLIAASAIFSDTISLWLYGVGDTQLSDETLLNGSQLTEDIVEEGTVLLKNENGALPLSDAEIKKVNVFGWAAYDWMTSAFGSGFSNTSLEKIKLFPALKEAGIKYNETLYKLYENFYSSPVEQWGLSLDEYRGDVEVPDAYNPATPKKFFLHEPGAGYYTDAVKSEARAFSSVALVVIGRTGGEAADLRMNQTKQEQVNGSDKTLVDDSRRYLQLSTEEEQMIAVAKECCEKVIVLLNTSNTMEVGFLNDEGIDAALLVGLTGMTGVRSVIDLLRGKDKDGNPVTPSGRTADIYAYDISTAPSSVNAGYGGSTKYINLDSTNNYTRNYYDAYIDYYEGIYVGYRWYETAAKEGYLDYNSTVQYPFGYGRSYTTFAWSVDKILVNGEAAAQPIALHANDVISVTVRVKNTGDFAAKDVVQLYYTAPYTSGEVEKAYVVLGDFKKTKLIAPQGEDTVELTLSAQSMASYDCYDKNQNGHTGYELDAGDYSLKLMKNSHEFADMGEGESAEIACNLAADVLYNTDETTGEIVENRFTGNDTVDGYPIDGSRETTPVTYLSRADFAGTFPKKIIRERSAEGYKVATTEVPSKEQLARTGYGDVKMPETGASAELDLDDMLDTEGYDDEKWDDLLKQIQKNEMFQLIRDGFFKTVAIESVKKPQFADLDGPLGLNTRVTSSNSCSFIPYPSATMLAQTFNPELAHALGASVGQEAQDANVGIRGWYGPAANIHRNPYGGRNGEYYSEDGLLSGRMAAETIRGAKEKGLYCYLKHFVANDTETLREGLYTFLTEQSLREIYLKPFEIAVKEGGANALMTSMNRLGAVWSGGSRGLCTDILRNEWGFRGTLVTDWLDTGHSDYMPVYRGIWAGNDIWLNNVTVPGQDLFDNGEMADDPVFVTLAQKVSHDVLYTLVDTEQAAGGTRSLTSGGFVYNTSWIWWGIFPVCLVLFAGECVMAFFLARGIKRNKRAKAVEPTPEPDDTDGSEGVSADPAPSDSEE